MAQEAEEEEANEEEILFRQPPLDDYPSLVVSGASDTHANGIYIPSRYDTLEDGYNGTYCAPRGGRQVWRYTPARVPTLNLGSEGLCTSCLGTGTMPKLAGVRKRAKPCSDCNGGLGVDLEYHIVFMNASRVSDHENVGHCWELSWSLVGRGQHRSQAQAPPEAGYCPPPPSNELADGGQVVLPPEAGWSEADDSSSLLTHAPLPEMRVQPLRLRVCQLQMDPVAPSVAICLNLAGEEMTRMDIDADTTLQSLQEHVATALKAPSESLLFVLPSGQRIQGASVLLMKSLTAPDVRPTAS